jgi:hypothetical protein
MLAARFASAQVRQVIFGLPPAETAAAAAEAPVTA